MRDGPALDWKDCGDHLGIVASGRKEMRKPRHREDNWPWPCQTVSWQQNWLSPSRPLSSHLGSNDLKEVWLEGGRTKRSLQSPQKSKPHSLRRDSDAIDL